MYVVIVENDCNIVIHAPSGNIYWTIPSLDESNENFLKNNQINLSILFV